MTDNRTRGPKFPSVSLHQAIEALHPVFEAESRNKMSREVLAVNLGYSGLSGASTSKIGALRHFGLIEGREDELRVSDGAVTLLMREKSDSDYREAVLKAFLTPVLYSELFMEYDSPPSIQNVEFALVKRGVPKKRAKSAAEDFIESGQFANAWQSALATNTTAMDASSEEYADEQAEVLPVLAPRPHDGGPSNQIIEKSAAYSDAGFEEKSSGLLSKVTEYRLLVKGPLGASELKRLIRKVELDIEILLDESG